MESSTSDGFTHRQKVEWLLKRMAVFWGKAFFDKWAMLKDGEMLDEWEEALRRVSELELRRGIAKLKDFERPPSLPEFLKACRPEVNPLNAYYEALEGCRSRERGEVGTWTHPAIFWASVRVSAFELNTQSYSQIRARWETALAAELAKGQWEPIEAPKLALPPPGKDKASKAVAAKLLQELKLKTVVEPAKSVDPKGWARSILERHARGDKSLLPIQVQFARDALQQFEDD